jgi:hypothetical protein
MCWQSRICRKIGADAPCASSYCGHRHTIADDLNEPLPAELKIAYCCCRLAFIGRIPDEDARIATVNAHQTGECLSTGGDRCGRSGLSFFL